MSHRADVHLLLMNFCLPDIDFAGAVPMVLLMS